MVSRLLETTGEGAAAPARGWVKPPRELQLSHLAGVALCVGLLFGVGVYLLRQPALGPSHQPPAGIAQVRLIAPPDPGKAARELPPQPEPAKIEVPPMPAVPETAVAVVPRPKPASKPAPQAEASDDRSAAAIAALELPPSTDQLRDLASSTVPDFRKQLFAHIKRFRRYPDAARPAHLHGVVQLRIDMDRTGRVLGLWVKTSSGYAILDREAVDTIRRAQPLPALPPGFPDHLSILAPIEFGQVP